jgi:hypothetical protein
LPPIHELALTADETGTVPNSSNNASEDVVMVDSAQPATTNVHLKDLSLFSITNDVDYGDDMDVSAALEEVQKNKRIQLAAWTRQHKNAILRSVKSGLDHPMYSAYKTEEQELERMVRLLTEEYNNLLASINVGVLTTPASQSPATVAPTTTTVPDKKLTLDPSTPRFGVRKAGKTYTYPLLSDPHLFLDSFHSYCTNSYGSAFAQNAVRLLGMAVEDEETAQQLQAAFKQLSDSTVSWEECEKVFVDSVLSPSERFRTVAKVAKTGRNPKRHTVTLPCVYSDQSRSTASMTIMPPSFRVSWLPFDPPS